MSKNINKYLNMLLVQQKVELLSIALDLEIFKLLEEEKHTSLSLARKINTHEENTEILLDSLIFLELVTKVQEIYVNTQITRKFFIIGKESYCGDVFLHRKELLNKANKMLSLLIKEGNDLIKDSTHPEKWAEAAKENLKQEQKNLIAPFALNIVKELKEFKNFNKMLDLGCSSGIVALEFVKNYPSLNAVCFDYKEVTDVVKTHIKEYKLENKVNVLSGDIEEDDIGNKYDLIWCSNVFYFLKDRDQLIKKLYDALNPNGVLVTCHIEKNDKNIICENSFFYFLFLNLQGKKYLKEDHLISTFKRVGFKNIESFENKDFPMTPIQIHILKK
ncbi:methyltransferase [Arcobacter sp. F2176]|uniref:methyltransferase n=1 Tax=Arcobacter sp. F2176 TaxID=2044511 RepID=UPI00100B2594|nr:methyltransferase [Arcobacter sp. F2176]RXJ79782.1 methyltransferase [Arcobacter sp. F2176]